MKKKKKNSPPSVSADSCIYVGIDISKKVQHASFVSSALLEMYNQQYTKCPTLKFDNSQAGFESLIAAVQSYGDLEHCYVLFERTGHYSVPLEQFLTEKGVKLYRIQAKDRYRGDKTDVLDCLALGIMLYNQVGKRVVVIDKKDAVRLVVPPSPTARTLRGLVRQRTELVRELVRRSNKLRGVVDQVFPELTEIYCDPNAATALAVRFAFPTPADLAKASADEIYNKKIRDPKKIFALQDIAKKGSIGTRDEYRLIGLRLEQAQLIEQCQMLMRHVKILDETIEETINSSRDGRIIASLPGVGPILAALFISHIGSIANFDTEGDLRGYFGWAPRRTQTGTTVDYTKITRGGSRELKTGIYLASMNAIQNSEAWQALYGRLLNNLCHYNEREQEYDDKILALSHVIGSMIRVMYFLLRKDYNLLLSLPSGSDIPEPQLYDPAIHMNGLRDAATKSH